MITSASEELAGATESDAKRTSWISNIKYLVDNMSGKSTEEIKELKTLMESVNGNLKYNPSWVNKFSASEKINLRIYVDRVEKTAAPAPAPAPTPDVAPTPTPPPVAAPAPAPKRAGPIPRRVRR